MPNPYFRVSLKGRIGESEVWSVNPIFDPVGEPVTYTWIQEEGDAAAEAIAAFAPAAPLRAAWSSGVSLTSVRVEARDDQNDDLLGVSEYQLGTPLAGTGQATKTPQTALVASLRTNTPGASGRGRLYWPALGLGLTSGTWTITPTVSQDIATATAAYLRAISTELREAFAVNPWTEVQPVVFSRERRVFSPIRRVMVGNVLDTQRRRRDNVPETYQSAPLPAAGPLS